MITKEQIYLDQPLHSKQQVFEFIAQQAQLLKVTSEPEQIVSDLWERERVYSTGLQDQFAIPHTQSTAVKQAAVMVIRLNESIDWEAHDGQPVQYVFAILVPKNNVDMSHLQIISSLATLLLEDSFKRAIAHAEQPEEIYLFLNQFTEGRVS